MTVAILVVAVLTLLATLTGVYATIGVFKRWWPFTPDVPPPTQSATAKAIDILALSVPIDAYERVFGQPTFVTSSENYRERTFVTRFSVIQAVTDRYEIVRLFTASINGKSALKIDAKVHRPSDFSIELGVSTFSELPSEPRYIVCPPLGTRLPKYVEFHYFGIDGWYQTYIFGTTELSNATDSMQEFVSDPRRITDESAEPRSAAR